MMWGWNPRGLPFFVAAAVLFAVFTAIAANPGRTAAESAAPVTLREFAFKPQSVTVAAGSQVAWTNKDGVVHTVTANAGGFDSGTMAPEGVFTFTFKNAGTFEYFCDFHPFMKGTVVVTGATPAPSPVITAPTLVSPASAATLPSFGTTLRWENGAMATKVHLQVIPFNNDGPGVDVHLGSPETAFVIPAPPNWYGLLPDMTYNWRVRTSPATQFVGLDDPSWGAWGESTFRTPALPGLVITAAVPAAGSIVSTLTPALQWSVNRSDVFYFEVTLSKDSTFDTNPATATAMVYGALIHGGVTTPPNSYLVPRSFPLEPATAYFWRVRLRVQGDGRPADWSATSTFKTGSTPAPSPTAVQTPGPTASPASTAPPTPSTTPTAAPSPPATSTPTATPAPLNYMIAYASRLDGVDQLYAVRLDGSQQTRLTNTAAQELSATWSPDGARIAWVSLRDGNTEVYLMSASGADQLNMSESAGSDSQPAWSPDGSRLAWTSNRDGQKQIYFRYVNFTTNTTLKVDTGGTPAEQPAWFPDNNRLAVVANFGGGDPEICIVSALGADLQCITDNSSVDDRPAISPNGLQIAFVSDRAGRRDIYVMDVKGIAQTRLTTEANNDFPQWSPDGAKILFQSDRTGNWDLFAVNRNGSGLINLTKSPGSDTAGRWTPDGRSIVFQSDRSGPLQIYAMKPDGSSPVNLSNNGAYSVQPAVAPK